MCAWASRTVRHSLRIVAGSEHVKRVIEELLDVDPARIAVIPPGVDTEQMCPRPAEEALAGLLAECAADVTGDERMPDPGNAERIRAFFAEAGHPRVVYVGKISEEKGVPLLVDSLAYPGIVVGFGPARAALEVRSEALFTGPLQHRHLRYLWPLMDVSVVPSVFPEAFGMVAAEAAACGCPPLVADHSGLAEIAAGVRSYYPPRLAHLASFPRGDAAALAERLREYAGLSDQDRRVLSAGARVAAEELWSWDSVAERLLALATPPAGSA